MKNFNDIFRRLNVPPVTAPFSISINEANANKEIIKIKQDTTTHYCTSHHLIVFIGDFAYNVTFYFPLRSNTSPIAFFKLNKDDRIISFKSYPEFLKEMIATNPIMAALY